MNIFLTLTYDLNVFVGLLIFLQLIAQWFHMINSVIPMVYQARLH